MATASVRDLRLKTSVMLKQVARGQTFVIENRGMPVAELGPVTQRRSKKLPAREAFLRKLPLSKTDSGRITEEDRS